MNTFNDSLISTVDCLLDRLGPVNSLVDILVERLIPQAVAKACNSSCFVGCSGSPCYTGPCVNGQRTVSYIKTVGHPHPIQPSQCIPDCSQCGGSPCTVTQSC